MFKKLKVAADIKVFVSLLCHLFIEFTLKISRLLKDLNEDLAFFKRIKERKLRLQQVRRKGLEQIIVICNFIIRVSAIMFFNQII
jgi:hypothetical protein